MIEKTVQPFSAGYFIISPDVVEHTGDRLIVPRDYFKELSRYVSYPLIRVDNEHRWAYPQNGVPGRTAVLPDDIAAMDGGTPLLLAKDDTAHRLVQAGEKETPTP